MAELGPERNGDHTTRPAPMSNVRRRPPTASACTVQRGSDRIGGALPRGARSLMRSGEPNHHRVGRPGAGQKHVLRTDCGLIHPISVFTFKSTSIS